MSMKVAVIGAGVAGTAAAWALRRSGAAVTVVHDRAGASSLYAGALDVSGWETDVPDAPIAPHLTLFATALDAWHLGARGCQVATYEGVLRPARGIDAALLDVGPLAGRSVCVPDVTVAGWNASSLARSLSASAFAARTATTFRAVSVPGVLDASEGLGSPYDVAALHDDEGRAARLAESLDRAERAADAWLLGPWLGTTPGVAERLRRVLGKPIGETTSPPGGPAGARFEASRDALFAANAVTVQRHAVTTFQHENNRFQVGAKDGPIDVEGFDAMILAIGGLLAGIRVERGGMRTSLETPLVVGLGERLIGTPSTVHGVDVAALGLSALDRVGILTDGVGVRGQTGAFAAGDCRMDRPRTALEAASAGIAAALAATR